MARGGSERDSSQVIGAPLLGDPLLQKLHAVANGVAATEFGLCLLKKEVLAVVELCVCRIQAGRGDIRNLDLRQCPRERTRARPGGSRVHIRPAIGEAKLVGVAGAERVAVGEKKIVVTKRILLNKSRERSGLRPNVTGIVSVSPGEAVSFGLVVVYSSQPLGAIVGPGQHIRSSGEWHGSPIHAGLRINA